MVNIRLLKFIIFFFTSIISFSSNGQSSLMQFENDALIEALKKVEQSTDLIFNYDPQLLSEYSFSGNVDLSNSKRALQEILYNTPFEFEQSDNTFIIFKPEPRSYKICGYLKDSEGSEALSYANVYSQGGRYGTYSDSDGYFEFTANGYKNDVVEISYIGYKSRSFMIQNFNPVECINIFLVLDTGMFGTEIVVTDYILKGIIEGEKYGSVNINYDRLAKGQTNIEQDILKTVQLLPGISSVDETATNIQIRGSSADQNLIIWEGATLYDPGHFFGMISAINPFVIDEVKVFKGVFDPKYDDRVGGIVDMSLSNRPSRKFKGGIGTTFTEAHAFIDVPVIPEKLSVIASGRNALNDLYNTPTFSEYSSKVFQDSKVEDAEPEEPGSQVVRFYDYNVKIILKPVDRFSLTAGMLKTSNKFNYVVPFLDGAFSSRDIVTFDSEAASASMNFDITEKWGIHLGFTRSKYSNDYEYVFNRINNQTLIEQTNIFNQIHDQTLSFSNHFNLSSDLKMELGYDYNRKEVEFNLETRSESETDEPDKNFDIGRFHNGFMSFQYSKDKLLVNTGVRASFDYESSEWAFSPRLSAQYALNEAFKLKFSGGILQQYINQIRDFGTNELGVNTKVWVLSKISGDVHQESKKVSFGFIYNQNDWLFDLETYYHRTDGLSALSPLFGSSIEVGDFSSGKSMVKGVDVLLRKEWHGYNFWTNYTLSQVDFLFPEIAPDYFPGTNDFRHNLNINNSYQYKNWCLSMSYHYRSGTPFSEASRIAFEVDEEGEEEFYVQYDAYNQKKLPYYGRLDIGLSYKYDFSFGLKAEAAFSIQNLLNWDNYYERTHIAEYLDEDDGTNERLELFTFDRFLLQRTPQLLIRFYW